MFLWANCLIVWGMERMRRLLVPTGDDSMNRRRQPGVGLSRAGLRLTQVIYQRGS